MTTIAPSLFAHSPSPVQTDHSSSQPASCLVDLLYDGFYLLILLHNRSTPDDAVEFSARVQAFLSNFEKAAKKGNFSSEDIFDAKYALCASIDETILSS